ncbi:unnamed protein product [Diatraea saccharalis]|uniref:Uncharacterized protein n=1 Tax=Diatraea saccharalis TaxID=40085 RepID=A0A9N9W9I4_9NEOP|nr:unnamed protein product [Diatraea saccharalis]
MPGLPPGHIKLYIIINLYHVAPSEVKEGRKVGLLIPEKIIGGVIDIVHNHKNKPGSQGSYQQQSQSQQIYQPTPGYQPQYPSQPQYPQNQGNYQSQYQNQYQNQYQQQNGNYASNYYYPQVGYPTPSQNPTPMYQNTIQRPNYVNQGQQGQYQTIYPQNQINQQHQSSGHYQSGQFQGGQYQQTGQYQGGQNQQTGQYQNSQNQQTGQYHATQNQQTGQYNGDQNQQSNFQGQNQSGNQGGMNQPNNQFQMQGQGSSSTQSGGFQVSGGSQSGGPGPTCVCQAWTKPDPPVMHDPTQKSQEKSEPSEESNKISV